MARNKRGGNPFGSIRGAIDDMRTGLNDVDKSLERVELARLARILGILMLGVGLIYLVLTLMRLELFQ